MLNAALGISARLRGWRCISIFCADMCDMMHVFSGVYRERICIGCGLCVRLCVAISIATYQHGGSS